MKIDVVLGLQWGDEGKGKIVDVLAGRYPAVARFQGGPNAGHSLHFEGKSFVVRSIPSGIFRELLRARSGKFPPLAILFSAFPTRLHVNANSGRVSSVPARRILRFSSSMPTYPASRAFRQGPKRCASAAPSEHKTPRRPVPLPLQCRP